MGLFIPWNQSLCMGSPWPEEGFGSCLLAGESVLGAAVLLEGCGIPWVGFPSEICSAVPCLARNVELSFPVFLLLAWVQGRAEEPPARCLWQSAWAPTPRAEPGSWSWECGQCWELCCSSHTSPIPGAPAGSSSSPSPALAPGRALGAASVQVSCRGAASLGRLRHRDQCRMGPAPQPRLCPELGL